jgi:CRISPR-associated endonuclease/helicase Cas3
VLLRSLEVWRSATTVSIPDQIRERIEATYEERCEGEEPDAWQKLFIEMYGKKTVYQQLALQSSNIWTVALEDEEGVQTRLSELPTVQLILCRNIEARRCVFLNGDSETMGNDQHQLNVARAIQKNLVKVPKHIFKAVRPCAAFDQYLYGLQTLGVVSDERVRVDGLKDGVQIRWSTEGGLRIENDSKRSQE